MNRIRWLLLPAMLLATHAASASDYAQAKALADHDEARLERLTAEYLNKAQAGATDAIVRACAAPDADTAAFVVVARLDENGKAVETWRQGDTPLAICFEKELWGRTIVAPPHAPFHVSFEISFTP
ncbi:MAG: hypothetical protein QM769_10220 [Pseudoxanthomonas sp.]